MLNRGSFDVLPGSFDMQPRPTGGSLLRSTGVEGIDIAILGPRPGEARPWKNSFAYEKPRLPGVVDFKSSCKRRLFRPRWPRSLPEWPIVSSRDLWSVFCDPIFDSLGPVWVCLFEFAQVVDVSPFDRVDVLLLEFEIVHQFFPNKKFINHRARASCFSCQKFPAASLNVWPGLRSSTTHLLVLMVRLPPLVVNGTSTPCHSSTVPPGV